MNAPQQKWNFSPLPTGIEKVVGASNPTGLLESGAAPPQSLTFAAALASLQNYTVTPPQPEINIHLPNQHTYQKLMSTIQSQAVLGCILFFTQ